MIDEIQRINEQATERIAAASTLDELRSVETEVLGKKAPLTAVKKRLGELAADERKRVGQALNEARDVIGGCIGRRPKGSRPLRTHCTVRI